MNLHLYICISLALLLQPDYWGQGTSEPRLHSRSKLFPPELPLQADYRFKSVPDLRLRLRSDHVPPGKTDIFFPPDASKPSLTYNWAAAEVFFYPKQENAVVAYYGHRVASPQHAAIGFYSGTNLLKQYSVNDLRSPLRPNILSIVPKNPIRYCWGQQRAAEPSGEHFFAETREGIVLQFDLRTGTILSRELKYRSLCFTSWYRGKSANAPSGRKLIVGELFSVDLETSLLRLIAINELSSGTAQAEYEVKAFLTPEFRNEAKPGTLCGLVVDQTPDGELAREAVVFPYFGSDRLY